MPMSPEELAQRRAAANPPRAVEDELLDSGQEEVFSRTEVTRGRIEHEAHAGDHEGPTLSQVRQDEAQTQRQAPDNASPGEPSSGA